MNKDFMSNFIQSKTHWKREGNIIVKLVSEGTNISFKGKFYNKPNERRIISRIRSFGFRISSLSLCLCSVV
ncbi:hypothetical protein VNO78_17760 [Psophocarpus tetragonolobus]|uniref:Uncharacterized protein n=1 Tax=Psophocarpus tetragonolobus TaxID=3891 RepID=A0AAN9SHB5_PSOTE